MSKRYATAMAGLGLFALPALTQAQTARHALPGPGQASAWKAPAARQAGRLALPGINGPVTIPSNAPPRTSRPLSKEEINEVHSQLERKFAAVHKQPSSIGSATASVRTSCGECAALERQTAALQVLKQKTVMAPPPASPESGVPSAPAPASSKELTRPPSAGNSKSPAGKPTSKLNGTALPSPGQLAGNPRALSVGVATNVCMIPQIYRVNGASSHVVFTQDPSHNDYIIEGCKFGEAAGQIYLSGAVANGRINMVVKSWSTSRIEAMVDQTLAGALDGWPDLIVQPVNQAAVKLPNCRFYAQRQTVLLKKIPLNSARLANVNVQTEYCDSNDQLWNCWLWLPQSGTFSNGVDRESESFLAPGEDEYNFDSLAPGFVVNAPGPYWYADSMAVCKAQSEGARLGDSFEYSTQGLFRAYKKSDRRIVVDWGVEHCAWKWMAIFSVSDFFSSGYSLQVHVEGPLCVDPWTGKPDQACIADLKKYASQH